MLTQATDYHNRISVVQGPTIGGIGGVSIFIEGVSQPMVSNWRESHRPRTAGQYLCSRPYSVYYCWQVASV